MTNEQLIEKIKQGSTSYMEELYSQNLPLIRKFISPFVNDRQEMEDCMQEAYFGLSDAVQRYDADSEIKFMTFARWYIIHAVQHYLYNSSLIRLPQHQQEKISKYKKAVATIFNHGEKPTKEAIEKKTGISPKEQDIIVNLIKGTKSLDKELETSEGDTISILDMLPSGENLEENTVDTFYKNNMHSEIWAAVHDNLSEREEYIIIQSIIYNASLRQIADKTNVSYEYVRKTKAKAIRHLRIRCKRLLEGYAETECILYRGGFETFRHHQESNVERIVDRRLELEEKYNRIMQEHERIFAQKIKRRI